MSKTIVEAMMEKNHGKKGNIGDNTHIENNFNEVKGFLETARENLKVKDKQRILLGALDNDTTIVMNIILSNKERQHFSLSN